MVGRLALSDSQATRYRQVRDSFMVATQPQHDSARAAAQAMRDAFQAGDRAAAAQTRGTLRRVADYLSQRQKEFDEVLKPLLNSEQWKAYTQWRDERKRQADEERHRRLDGRSQGPPGS